MARRRCFVERGLFLGCQEQRLLLLELEGSNAAALFQSLKLFVRRLPGQTSWRADGQAAKRGQHPVCH
eukprot:2706120-Lingulodinium_polyedra.AAC.1